MKRAAPDRAGQTWEEDWDDGSPPKLWLITGHDGNGYQLLFNLETGAQSYVWDDALESPPAHGWKRIA